MITTSSNYDIYNAKQNKSPVWVLEFNGISTKFASGNFSGITSSYKTYISSVEINRRSENFLDPRSYNSHASVSIIDKDAEITALLPSNNFYATQATIKQGFKELDVSDFITVFSGKVTEINIASGVYNFVIDDFLPTSRDFLFKDIQVSTIQNRISKAHYAFTTSSSILSGSSVSVSVSGIIDSDLRDGDSMWVTSSGGGETPEFIEIESIDRTTNTIVFSSIAGSHTVSSTFSTYRISISTAFATALSASRSNYTNPPFDNTTYLHVKIGNEILQITTIDTSAGTLTINSRGFDLTDAEQHDDGSEIRECYFLQEEPVKMFLNLLTTTDSGTNGSYDIGRANWGLGIDQSFVNITAIEAIDTTYFNNSSYEFTMLPSSQEDAVSFLIRDILQPLSLYLFIDGDGLINVGRLNLWSNASSVHSITDSDVILGSQDLKMIIGFVNNTTTDINYNWGTLNYEKTYNHIQQESIDEYGVSDNFYLKSRGIREGSFSTIIIRDFLKNLTSHYANPYLSVKFGTFFNQNILELGDIIDVTSSYLIDFENGDRSINAKNGQIRALNSSNSENTSIELEMFAKDYANVFNINTLDDVDIDASAGGKSAATLDADNTPTTVNAQDAVYDNSAGLNVESTKITVVVNATLTIGGATASFRCTIGENGVTAYDTATDTIVGSGLVTFTFSDITRDVYDVKLDYYNLTAGSATVYIQSITYETDQAFEEI